MNEHEFKKQYGQNFLVDMESIIFFVDMADIKEGEQVLEIGPGDGSVTDQLLARGAEVIAVEIDLELIDALRERFEAYSNFKVINANIFDVKLEELGLKPGYKVVSSLPYNISKQIINIFLRTDTKPKSLTFIIQKEVGQDYTALKGKFLSILTQTYCKQANYLKTLPAHMFYPKPKVESAIIQFQKIGSRIKKPEEFLKFVKIGFSSPRKILSRNLSNALFDKDRIEKILIAMKLSQKSRAGELNFNNWLELYEKTRS